MPQRACRLSPAAEDRPAITIGSVRYPGIKTMTPESSDYWKYCCMAATLSAVGPPNRFTKPLSQHSRYPPPPTDLTDSVKISAS